MTVRRCAHTTCVAEADACLRFDYTGRAAWLDDLDPVGTSESYDLCAVHADALVVPVGWTRTDRRAGTRTLFHHAS
jgi:hypothetical protein